MDHEEVGTNAESALTEPRRGLFRRFRGVLAQFKRDLREPLSESDGKPWLSRCGARTRHLFKRYGWKLFWGIVVFYLIRDTVLYIIIPYLIARKLIS
jgi:hypothetical protein